MTLSHVVEGERVIFFPLHKITTLYQNHVTFEKEPKDFALHPVYLETSCTVLSPPCHIETWHRAWHLKMAQNRNEYVEADGITITSQQLRWIAVFLGKV